MQLIQNRVQNSKFIFKNNLYIKQLFNFKSKNKRNVNIPLNIYQTYKTLDLPMFLEEGINILKKNNPEFKFHLFDNDMCREFIKNNFNKDVLEAFDSFIPGAFKADLWRYCILYINGGIYLDIKYKTYDNCKLIDLINQQYFVRDIVIPTYNGNPTEECEWCEGIYQAFLVSEKKQKIYMKFINKIVENYKNKLYFIDPLYYTGPLLVSEIIYNNIELTIDYNLYDLKLDKDNKLGCCILYKDKPFLLVHKREDYYKFIGDENHYSYLCKNKKIYIN